MAAKKKTRHGATQPEADRVARGVFLRMLPVHSAQLDVLAERWGCTRSEVVATLVVNEIGRANPDRSKAHE